MKPLSLGFLLPTLFLLLHACDSTSSKQQNQRETPIAHPPIPASDASSLPYLLHGADGNLYLSWVEENGSNATLKYSRLGPDNWTPAETIASGSDWFVNWADYPMIAVDSSGNMIAHFLAKSSVGTYSYDIKMVTKHADSSNWSTPMSPHRDHTPTEHGFVSMLPLTNQSFLLVWLDGRNTGGAHGSHSGSMTLRTAVVDLQGNLTQEKELDNRVCDCCQTTAAMTTEGPLVAYRDRSVDEIRDIAFVTGSKALWTQPTEVARDGWQIAGCPVNGPRMDSYEESAAIAWFSAANNRPVVKVAFWDQHSFLDPIVIDAKNPMGRVDIAMIDRESAIVSWVSGSETPSIMIRTVSRSGSLSQPIRVTDTSSDRASGFPQLEIFNNVLYLANTAINEENSRIRLSKIEIQELF